MLVVRMDAQLYYANASFFKVTIKSILNKTIKNRLVHTIVIDASGINQIDSSAVTVLTTLKEELNKQNINLEFSCVKGPVKDVLKLSDYWNDDCKFLNTHKAVIHAQENNLSK